MKRSLTILSNNGILRLGNTSSLHERSVEEDTFEYHVLCLQINHFSTLPVKQELDYFCIVVASSNMKWCLTHLEIFQREDK